VCPGKSWKIADFLSVKSSFWFWFELSVFPFLCFIHYIVSALLKLVYVYC